MKIEVFLLLKLGIFQAAMLVVSWFKSWFNIWEVPFWEWCFKFLPPVRKKVDRTFLTRSGTKLIFSSPFLASFTPPKTNMTMEHRPFEDGSSIQNWYFGISYYFWGGKSKNFMRYCDITCPSIWGPLKCDPFHHQGKNVPPVLVPSLKNPGSLLLSSITSMVFRSKKTNFSSDYI